MAALSGSPFGTSAGPRAGRLARDAGYEWRHEKESSMSKTHRLIVFSQPSPGREDEYNRWYDEVHLREVLEIDGFVAAQRFRLGDAQIGEPGSEAPAPYLAIYEIEAESLEAALGKLDAASGTMDMSEALDLPSARAIAYSAIGERRSAS